MSADRRLSALEAKLVGQMQVQALHNWLASLPESEHEAAMVRLSDEELAAIVSESLPGNPDVLAMSDEELEAVIRGDWQPK